LHRLTQEGTDDRWDSIATAFSFDRFPAQLA